MESTDQRWSMPEDIATWRYWTRIHGNSYWEMVPQQHIQDPEIWEHRDLIPVARGDQSCPGSQQTLSRPWRKWYTSLDHLKSSAEGMTHKVIWYITKSDGQMRWPDFGPQEAVMRWNPMRCRVGCKWEWVRVTCTGDQLNPHHFNWSQVPCSSRILGITFK